MLRVADGRRRRPVVLVADRGRGKSAALGIAIGRLLRDAPRAIAVVAPRRAAVEPVFAHAAATLGIPWTGGNRLAVAGGGLRFVGPAELAEGARGPGERPRGIADAALVVVDEAAGLPVELLTRLLRAHPRIVFATTIHGYEGTGQGFAVRFCGVLDREAPGWRTVRLGAPVRWAAGDPVEAAVFRALLLDAAPVDDGAAAGASGATVTVERWDRDGDTATLRPVFGLLVLAHHRTSPADLERLLDAPNVSVWVARQAGAVVATAVIAGEGGFDGATAAAIHAGRRRPPGHLLPETLAMHLGVAAAPTLRAARVVRIAVHPAAQGRGIGRALLAGARGGLAAAGVDWMGAAFGCTARLLAFWRGAGFEPVRVGVQRGASSGLHAAVVASPLSAAGAEVVAAARRRYGRWLPAALGEALAGLDPALAVALLRGAAVRPAGLDADEAAELARFAAGGREREAVVDLLARAAPEWLAAGAVTGEDAAALARGILQRGAADAGRTAAQARLRATVAAAARRGA
ncbi:MAG: GNAT family N-acetyltransferase [bacterium]